MKIYCENCMGENEIDENQITADGYRAMCKICGYMIYIDEEAVKALLLRQQQTETPSSETEDSTEQMSSVAQSNVSTTVAAKIDIPKNLKTSPAIIKIIDGPDVGLDFSIDIPRITIGRRGADLNLNDRLVSRRHVAIEAAGGRFLLKDLGSTNGTFLNGSPISMEFLKHQDEIQIGSTLIQFKIQTIDDDIVTMDK